MNSMLAMGTLLSLSILGQVGSSAPAGAAKPAASSARPTIQLKEAFQVVPVREAKLSASQHGAIVELPAKEGQAVKQGDILGQLDDRVAKAAIAVAEAELRVAEKQAESDAPVQAAIATQEVAEKELQKSIDINVTKPNTINATELERLRLTVKKAEYQILVAEQEFQAAKLNAVVKEAQLRSAELDAEMRRIRAPYDGEVIQVIRNIGEWVQAGDPVLHLVDMQRLRVQGYIYVSSRTLEEQSLLGVGGAAAPHARDADLVDPSEIVGRDCEVIVELPKGKQEVFKAKVDYVSPVQELGGRVRVWVEIENRKVAGRWVAQPGQMAYVKVILDPPAPPKPNAPKDAPKADAGNPPAKPAPAAQDGRA